MKNQKGITLIALVVTIIVLLILAGVAIAMLTGDNSILDNASKSSSNNAYYSAREQAGLAYSAVATEIKVQTVSNGTYSGKTKIQDLAELVRKDLTDSKWTIQVGDAGSDTIYLTYSDKAIDKEIIQKADSTVTPALEAIPAEEGVIHCKITVTGTQGQACELKFDDSSITVPNTANTVKLNANGTTEIVAPE